MVETECHGARQRLETVSAGLPGSLKMYRSPHCAGSPERIHRNTCRECGGGSVMRSEIETVVEDIKRSVGLLRRHL
jgi:hypothetical protein